MWLIQYWIGPARDQQRPWKFPRFFPCLWINTDLLTLGDYHILPSNNTPSSHTHIVHFHVSTTFWLIKKLIPAIVSTQYLPITFSDHATIILDLHFNMKPEGFRNSRLNPLYSEWRLNPEVLQEFSHRTKTHSALCSSYYEIGTRHWMPTLWCTYGQMYCCMQFPHLVSSLRRWWLVILLTAVPFLSFSLFTLNLLQGRVRNGPIHFVPWERGQD